MSAGIAALIAHGAFWAILALGLVFGEIARKGTVVFLVLWALGFFGLPRISAFSGQFVAPYIAVLDIALAFIVFKGDVRLS